jgi:hypothetical protein
MGGGDRANARWRPDEVGGGKRPRQFLIAHLAGIFHDSDGFCNFVALRSPRP